MDASGRARPERPWPVSRRVCSAPAFAKPLWFVTPHAGLPPALLVLVETELTLSTRSVPGPEGHRLCPPSFGCRLSPGAGRVGSACECPACRGSPCRRGGAGGCFRAVCAGHVSGCRAAVPAAGGSSVPRVALCRQHQRPQLPLPSELPPSQTRYYDGRCQSRSEKSDKLIKCDP